MSTFQECCFRCMPRLSMPSFKRIFAIWDGEVENYSQKHRAQVFRHFTWKHENRQSWRLKVFTLHLSHSLHTSVSDLALNWLKSKSFIAGRTNKNHKTELTSCQPCPTSMCSLHLWMWIYLKTQVQSAKSNHGAPFLAVTRDLRLWAQWQWPKRFSRDLNICSASHLLPLQCSEANLDANS